MTGYRYEGDELAVFAHAVHWKQYVSRLVRPYLGQSVLEVGAGLGTTTEVLARGFVGRWTCLEPDAALAREIDGRRARGLIPGSCDVVVGSLAGLETGARYDTILYMDVLEHIQDDASEMARAAAHLAPGGSLVVLAPAHQWLFAPFDEAIGHHRRYDRASLGALTPPGLRQTRLVYLDSVGLLASAANRLLLRSAHPSATQVAFWDRCMVPVSRVVDPILGHTIGKSILGVWQHRASSTEL
jgi:SAM-dependent methyltransferase